MLRLMLARIGLARPPYTKAALEVQGLLRAMEQHLAHAKDRQGMMLAHRLHDRLWTFASEVAPGGAVDLAPLSGGTPKPASD